MTTVLPHTCDILNQCAHDKLFETINAFNLKVKKKLRVKWLSDKVIKEKIYPYKKLLGWTPIESSKNDIIDLIHKDK